MTGDPLAIVHTWTLLGTTFDGGPVYAAPAGTPPGEPFDPDAGYRPYHDPACPARDAKTSPDICTCSGLDKPCWRPGDAP